MSDAFFYQYHLFFCTNLKAGNKGCGAKVNTKDLAQYAKEKLMSLNLHGPEKVRISQSQCLGRCKLGPSLVVYPDGVWYNYSCEKDIDLIIENHLIKGGKVASLLMKMPEKSSA